MVVHRLGHSRSMSFESRSWMRSTRLTGSPCKTWCATGLTSSQERKKSWHSWQSLSRNSFKFKITRQKNPNLLKLLHSTYRTRHSRRPKILRMQRFASSLWRSRNCESCSTHGRGRRKPRLRRTARSCFGIQKQRSKQILQQRPQQQEAQSIVTMTRRIHKKPFSLTKPKKSKSTRKSTSWWSTSSSTKPSETPSTWTFWSGNILAYQCYTQTQFNL